MASGAFGRSGRLPKKVDPLSEPRSPCRVACVTGRLATAALREVLDELEDDGGLEFELVTLEIAVAALITVEWALPRLKISTGIERVILPGHCRGDTERLATSLGIPVELGPKDLRELPAFFGREAKGLRDYGAYKIEIVAEINHVPRLDRSEVLAVARHYAEDGADIIDLGCDPGEAFTGIGEVTRALRDEGLRVSVDSMNPQEIESAVRHGAELVLSVNSSNVDAVAELECEFVAIPDEPTRPETLEATVAKLVEKGRAYRVDPVLEPIGFGFAASLDRYLRARETFPDAEMLLGIGNLTELTGTDSAPLNVLLLGFCAELKIHSVLTTEVAPWTRTCVRELDLARRLVHHAVSGQRLPKHVEPRLHVLRDEQRLEFGPERLESLAQQIKDRNFRIFAEDGMLHVMNSQGHHQGKDPFELFAALGVSDSEHAFYLGYELAKAVTALSLGKNYVQDQALNWGFLTRPEESYLARKHGGPQSNSASRRPTASKGPAQQSSPRSPSQQDPGAETSDAEGSDT